MIPPALLRKFLNIRGLAGGLNSARLELNFEPCSAHPA